MYTAPAMGILDKIRSFLELRRAGSAEARGDLAVARERYREALGRADDSNRAAILNKLGVLSDAMGDKHAARSWFEQASVADPDEWAPYMNLGNVLDRLGERDAARGAYAQALDRTRRPDLLYNYAVFLAADDPRAAVTSLRECLESGPAMDEVGLPAELPLQTLVRLGERDDLFEEVSRQLLELESKPIGLRAVERRQPARNSDVARGAARRGTRCVLTDLRDVAGFVGRRSVQSGNGADPARPMGRRTRRVRPRGLPRRALWPGSDLREDRPDIG